MAQTAGARGLPSQASVAETGDDPLFTLDAEGRITSLGPAFEALTGWSRADWMGCPVAGLLHPQDSPRVTEIHRALRIKNLPRSIFTARILTSAGRYVSREFVAIWHGESGHVVGRLAVAPSGGPASLPGAADLRGAGPRGIAIVCADGQGRIVHFDPTAQRMFQYRPEEVTGRPLSLLVAAQCRTLVEQQLAGLLGSADAVAGAPPLEVAGLRHDGSEFPLEAAMAGWKTAAGDLVMAMLRDDVAERRLAHRALRRMNELREEEARRIARELHDEAGQLLASVHVALVEWARELPDTGTDQLRRVQDLLEQIEVRLREVSHELRPTILDDLGLVPALEFLAGRMSKRTGVRVTVEARPSGRLPALVETTLYRVAQEALTNVARHARATTAWLRFEWKDGLISCAIGDDGIGFDVPAMLARRGEHGLGLVGIRERVASLAGTVEIESAPGRGTMLRVTIPLEA